jgi:hypothetical protein
MSALKTAALEISKAVITDISKDLVIIPLMRQNSASKATRMPRMIREATENIRNYSRSGEMLFRNTKSRKYLKL